jgi:hypothetical protein
VNRIISGYDPGQPTLVVQQVDSYLGYTGGDDDIVAEGSP